MELEPPEAQYASWIRRLVAIVIDGLVVGLLGSIVFVGLISLDGGFSENADTGVLTVLGVLLGFLLIPAGYEALLVARDGQTLGKKVLRIRVVSDTGGRVVFANALARWFVRTLLVWLFWIPYVIDCLWPLWDRRNQSLHDKAARTIVVDAA
jgi:uncharacterized RDD family membrane protein YckC